MRPVPEPTGQPPASLKLPGAGWPWRAGGSLRSRPWALTCAGRPPLPGASSAHFCCRHDCQTRCSWTRCPLLKSPLHLRCRPPYGPNAVSQGQPAHRFQRSDLLNPRPNSSGPLLVASHVTCQRAGRKSTVDSTAATWGRSCLVLVSPGQVTSPVAWADGGVSHWGDWDSDMHKALRPGPAVATAAPGGHCTRAQHAGV